MGRLALLWPALFLLVSCQKTPESLVALTKFSVPPTLQAPKFLSFTDAETASAITFSPNAILLATDGGLVSIDRQTREASVLDEQSGISGHNLRAVLWTPDAVWVAGNTFLSRYQQRWQNMPGVVDVVGLAPDTKANSVLLAAKSGLFRSTDAQLTELSKSPLNAIQNTPAGIFMAGDEGLSLFQNETVSTLDAWKNKHLFSVAISGETIIAITKDKEGRPRSLLYGTKERVLGALPLWEDAVVTGNAGCALQVGRRLYRLIETKEKTAQLALPSTNKGFLHVGVTDRVGTALAIEGERVFVGLPSFGVTAFGGEIERYASGDLLPINERAFLGSDSKGAVFVPTRGPYLAKFIEDRFVRLSAEPDWDATIIAVSSRNDQVFFVVQVRPGGPLLIKKLQGDEPVEIAKVSLNTLPRRVFATFFEVSPEGDFWLGIEDETRSSKGLLWVSQDGKTLEHLRRGSVGVNSSLAGVTLPSDAVAQVRFVKGASWLATNGGLVWRKGEKMRTFGENEGLDSELVRDVAVDRLELVWLATGSGVGVLQQGALWNFDRYRDVLGDLRVRALLNDTQGTMWVGTDNGTFFWKESPKNAAGEWGNFSRKNGLCGDLVSDLAEDALGRVWHLTEGGFCVGVNPQ
jgi:hypothetical protein